MDQSYQVHNRLQSVSGANTSESFDKKMCVTGRRVRALDGMSQNRVADITARLSYFLLVC